MSIRTNLPNFFTICNLLCGCAALVFVSRDALVTASYLMWAAAMLDFADGYVARAVKAYSELGKQLDSLADMVSFGVLPAYIMFALIDERTTHPILPFIAFLIAAFSALRLAKFNIDTRQTHAFIGVPTPANALLISSFPFILKNEESLVFYQFLDNPIILIVLTFLLSYLLIANVELIAFKFKQRGWKGNEARYVFIILALSFFAVFGIAAIPLVFVLYLLLSIANNFFINKPDHQS